MKSKALKRIGCVLLTGAMLVSLIPSTAAVTDAAVKAKKIVMQKSSVTIEIGTKFTLKVKKVIPAQAKKNVVYKSSSKKTAKVTSKGVVTGVKVGKCKITVTSKSNKKVKASVKVSVIKAKNDNATPSVSPLTVQSAAPVVPSAVPTIQPNVTTPTPVTNTTATPTIKPTATPVKKTKAPATPTPVPTEKPKGSKDGLDGDVFVVSLEKELEIADGVTTVLNDDGTRTIDFTGTTYKGARFIFDKSLDLTDYNYLYVDGTGADGKPVEDYGICYQLLDALDKDEYGNAAGVGTVRALTFPINYEYTAEDDRCNVTHFEFFSDGDETTPKGPIVIKRILICKSKEACDKYLAELEKKEEAAVPTDNPDPDSDTDTDPVTK